MKTSEAIRRYRRRSGLSMEELGRLLSVSRQTVFRYESGAIENIPRDKIRRMAEILKVSEGELLGVPDVRKARASGARAVPMLGEIACGEPIYADEQSGHFVLSDETLEADFCLRAKGDSMIGARIYDGDVVFVHAQETVENGEIGVVVIGDEATLKRVYYYPTEGKLILSPENPRYAPLVYLGDELEEIRILGKAVAFQSVLS